MTTEELPYRVVTSPDNQGWYATSVPGGGRRYEADYGARRGLEPMTLDELTERWQWRPVREVAAEDVALIEGVFDRIGRKSIATLAAALEQVWHDLRQARGGLANPSESADYAERTLTAGRAGSWESELLKEVVWFGNELNLAPAKKGEDNSVEARRKRGPASTRRVDVDGRQALADMLMRWVTGPDRYTEVAATLASVVSMYADRKAGAGGWKAVADQWLQPGAMDERNFRVCYRLFYSQSAHFRSELLS